MYRLSQVLTKLNMGESLDPQALADEFGVNLRTIQRDLNVRFGCLPLVKLGGRYRMEEAHLGKLTIKDIVHFASLTGVNGLFPELTDKFLQGIFDSANASASAWMVRGHHYEDLRGQVGVFTELERAIVGHCHVQFTYNKRTGQSKFHSLVEPYKLVNHKGIWYLAAWDADKLKSFSITKIEALSATHTTFVPRPAVDEELTNTDSIWLGSPRIRVLLRVNGQVAEYFRRRQLVPNQVIEKELPGGAILVATRVVSADEILPIVRYWIPHVRVAEPPDFQQQLEASLSDYLSQSQEAS